jgi:hypothetical protein
VDLPVPPLARLALGTGHHQARNSHCLASCRLSPVLDLEGAARPTRTTCPFARGPRSDPRDVPRESQLGCSADPLLKLGIDISESSVSKYMVRCRKSPSQTWHTFLENHARQLVSIDFLTVPTIRFQILYVWLANCNFASHRHVTMLHLFAVCCSFQRRS